MALGLTNLGYLYANAVDVPHWDQWEQVMPGALGPSPTWHWLVGQHNEHRIVPTNILDWLLYRVDGWDMRVLLLVNFVLYLTVSLVVWQLERRLRPNARALPILWPLFFVPWMSTSARENFLWGFQNCFHFVLLFLLLAVLVVFRSGSARSLWGGALLIGSMIFSFSSGIPGGLTAALVMAAFVLHRECAAHGLGAGFVRAARLLAGPLLLVLLCVWFWIHDYVKPPQHPAVMLPTRPEFWVFTSHLLARSFGLRNQNDALFTVLWALVGVGSIAVLLRSAELRARPATWAWLAVSLSVTAMLATISMGRAGFGADAPVSSRYAEIATVLVFPTVLLCTMAVASLTSSRQLILLPQLLLLALLAFAYRQDFDYDGYRVERAARLSSVSCIRQYLSGQNRGVCPQAYPAPIPDRIERARELNLRFTRPGVSPTF